MSQFGSQPNEFDGNKNLVSIHRNSIFVRRRKRLVLLFLSRVLPIVLALTAATTFLMIIKGIFRRYERWNPVHPTMGTFWGMGIGIGCGVGWGPGFGPEVIGYVGAGCGVGFSVGITLAGLGVGLPQNGLVQILYNAVGTNSTSFDLVRSHPLAAGKSVLDDSLNYATPHVSFLKKETSSRLSRLRTDTKYIDRFDLNKLNVAVSNQIESTLECLEAFKDKLWPPREES